MSEHPNLEINVERLREELEREREWVEALAEDDERPEDKKAMLDTLSSIEDMIGIALDFKRVIDASWDSYDGRASRRKNHPSRNRG